MKLSRSFKFLNKDFSQAEKFLIIGGYGSGKSQGISQQVLISLTQRKHKVAFIRKSFSTHNNSTYSLLKRLIQDELSTQVISKMGKTTTSIQFKNGSEIIFLGLDDNTKLKSLDGVERIIIEEASEIYETDFNEILGRLRIKNSKVILSTNPLSERGWIFQRFFNNANLTENELIEKKEIIHDGVFYHHSTVMDNPFVPELYINELKNYKITDPFRYATAFLGRCGILGKRVFENIEIDDYSNIRGHEYFGGDFGFITSYNSIVKVIISRSGKDLYIIDEIYSRGQSNQQIADDIKENGWDNKQIYFDNAEPKSISELQNLGINASKCKKFGVKESIKLLKGFKIHIDKTCTNAIANFTEECYKEVNGVLQENQFTIDNHTRDSVIYALSHYAFDNLKGDHVHNAIGAIIARRY